MGILLWIYVVTGISVSTMLTCLSLASLLREILDYVRASGGFYTSEKIPWLSGDNVTDLDHEVFILKTLGILFIYVIGCLLMVVLWPKYLYRYARKIVNGEDQ